MARRIRQWIGFLIMLAGLGLLTGPFLLGAREEKVQEQVVDSFYQGVGKAQTVPTALSADETQTVPTALPTVETQTHRSLRTRSIRRQRPIMHRSSAADRRL